MKLLQNKKVENKNYPIGEFATRERSKSGRSCMISYSKMQSGYTLLFAVLTATLVLGVAVFILGVSRKQLALAAAARDSMYSLYAADSGIECAAAAYAAGTLATSTSSGSSQDASIPCAGMSAPASASWKDITTLPSGWRNGKESHTPMNLGIDANNKTCAQVVVLNGYDADWNNVVLIESRGYNYCDTTTNTPKASSRTVERAFRLVYQ